MGRNLALKKKMLADHEVRSAYAALEEEFALAHEEILKYGAQV